MSENECCCNESEDTCNCSEGNGVRVKVNVDVPKIVKYSCLTAVLIVGIIFGTKCFRDMLKEGFFNQFEK